MSDTETKTRPAPKAAVILTAAAEQRAVDAQFAGFVRNDGDPHALALGGLEQMADQGRLPGSEESGDDQCGNSVAHPATQ